MTDRQRVEALLRFGYNEREAAFLCLAALHSGYFLARQVASFLGRKRGRPDDTLIRKALALGHCARRAHPGATRILHLGSRPLFAALGEPDNRNRRRRPPPGILRKLMQLDYVIENPDLRFLATEREKVAYFLAQPNVEEAHLPTRIYRSRDSGAATRRRFVDKFPIHLPAARGDFPAAPGFCYVEAGAPSISGFATHLEWYRPLIGRLPRSSVVYVSDTDRNFPAARRRFEAFLEGFAGNRADPAPRLLRYFRLERLYETERFHRLNREDLIRLRNGRREFRGDLYRSLFALWKSAGDRAVLDRLRAEGDSDPGPAVAFSTYRLGHNYEPLGPR